MSEIKEGVNAQTPIVKRGVSNRTQAVSQLRFHERDAAKNGLFIGCLADVSVAWSTNKDTGVAAPRLVFHFTSMHENAAEKRHVYHSINYVESNVETIPGGKQAWRVSAVFSYIKHFLDVFYLKGRELTPEEEAALELSVIDYDVDGSYQPVEPDTVINAYRVLFDNAAAMFNGTFNLKEGVIPRPTFKTADGKPIVVWMKLLRCQKVKSGNSFVWKNISSNGELSFTPFVGSGVVEIWQPNTTPKVLQIDLAKESIVPKEIDKAPINPSIPGTPMIGNVAPTFAPVDNTAYTDAGAGADGMPF